MLDIKNFLTVLSFDGSDFTDNSKLAGDFARGGFDVELSDTQYLYVGFYKPLSTFFIELETPSDAPTQLTLEYFNGSQWLQCSSVHDDTNAFSRSGFIQVKGCAQSLVEINEISKYFYRLSTSGLTEARLKGLGLIYSDDQSLINEYNPISKFLGSRKSFVNVHVSVRDDIIQHLTNIGKMKIDSKGEYIKLSPYDLLDISDIKLAATHGALAKLLHEASDEPNDTYDVKSKQHYSKYLGLLAKSPITLDLDDDGIKSSSETPKRVRSYFLER